MPPRGQDPNATSFNAADVIGSEGIAGHGELLLQATEAAYPAEVQAAQDYRENIDLTAALSLRGSDYDDMLDAHRQIAKIAGIDADRVVRAVVRGGADEEGRNRDPAQAWVSYVALDDTGDNNFKGVYPYLDHEDGSSDRHFSQLRAAASTPAGEAYLAARLKRDQAAETAGAADEPAPPADPFAALRDAKASELVAMMEDHPERVDSIKAFEMATRGEKARATVMDFEAESPEGGNGSEGGGEGGPAEGEQPAGAGQE